MDILVMADSETKGKNKVDVHYVDSGIPFIVEEHFDQFFHGHGAYSLEDILQDQEIVYQSLQGTQGNVVAKDSSNTHPKSCYDRGESSGSTTVGNTSGSTNFESQLATDEAIARELQYMEDNLAATSLSDTTVTEAVLQETSQNPANVATDTMQISDLHTGQDNIDPDNMTYEELQSLGEAIGTESKGLSDELISSLQTSIYKTGFFSRKDKHEECVICCMPYKNREVLMTLPCKHHYHSHCAKRWLKINKVCPVCNGQVFGS